MPVFNNALAGAAGSGGAAAGYKIERSLRFDSGSSTYLSRTPSSEGNRKTWTWSAWVKKGDIISSGRQRLFSVRQGTTSNQTYIQFRDDNKLYVEGPAIAWLVNTNAIFRDPSAWGHVVVAFDTTQATASNRVRIYWNGVEQTLSGTFPTQNYADSHINNTLLHSIGNEGGAVAEFFNGGLAEIHHVDGQQLTASDFGEFDSNSVWQPKEFTGSYTETSGGTAISSATGAKPILNTSDDDGQTVSSGVRTDSNASSIVLALPLNGSNGGTTITDYHHTIKGSGSAKAVSIYTGSASGGAVTSTAVSKYYGSSFYAVRGATNNYTASDYIYRTGDSDLSFGTGDFCVEFWYYPTGLTSNSIIFDNRHPSTGWPTSAGGFALVVNAGGSIFAYTGGNQVIAHGSKLSANAWHHIAYTRDNGTERLFVDGDFFGTTASSSRNYNEDRFHLGSAANNGEGSDGYYQDLRIYKGAAKYTANFNPPVLGSGGVNSYYLKFADNSSNAALGTDSSGLSNTYTVNNLSVASGSGNDSLIDTPTNYSSDSGNNRGNYATWNPLQKYAAFTLSNGNLDFTDNNTVGGGDQGVHATIAPVSGKFYWEMTLSTLASENYIGISKSNKLTQTLWTGGGVDGYYYYNNGNKIGGGNGNGGQSYGASFTTGDVIGVAVDWDNGKVTFYKNGTSQGDAFTGKDLTGYVPAFYFNTNQSAAGVVNFGQRPFAYTPPTGYKSLCTANLSDPTIADGSTAMDATLYTGNGSTQTISGLNFSPDFAWVKVRNTTYSHYLYDIVRGATKELYTNATNAEGTNANGLTAFNNDGFTLGSDSGVNESAKTYVGWAWDGGTSTVSNTDGSITSSVRANASAGFSIVGWTGTSANGTIGHGLNAAPEFVIVKKRGGTGNWYCYHTGLTDATKYIWLNSTSAENTQTAAWNSTAPTSTVVHLGAEGEMNANGATSIAYCFAPVEGYSAFGSYTGNGSGDGPFVYTGFRPAWVLIKKTSSSTDAAWMLHDSTREPFNDGNRQSLSPNSSDAETTSAHPTDFLSNGFKIKTSGGAYNFNGENFIYAAFAENPFKTARAR